MPDPLATALGLDEGAINRVGRANLELTLVYLRTVYREPERAAGWLHQDNDVFGAAPLLVMLTGPEGTARVISYLAAETYG